jgi:hypothetical protein
MSEFVTRPWLIQRGQFKKTEEKEIIGLDSLISYDYMGASEFEFGALPASLHRITASWKDFTWFPIEEIKDADGQCLYVLCKKDLKEEVIKIVKLFASQEGNHTKEHVGLYDYIQCRSDHSLRHDFWWDVSSNEHFFSKDDWGKGNDWMVCFGNNIRRLVIAINKVCAKHEVKFSDDELKECPIVPPSREVPVRSELEIEEDWRKRDVVNVLYPDGNKTIIMKRKIVEVDDTDKDVVKVLVQTRSGVQKWLEIRIPLSIKRALLLNQVKDWPAINKIQKV